MDQPKKDSVLAEVFGTLAKASIWMKITAIIGMVIFGLSALLSLYGLIKTGLNLSSLISLTFIGVAIYLSYLLFLAAKATDKTAQSGTKEDAMVAMNNLRLYFIISAILMIIAIVLTIIAFIYIYTMFSRLMGGMGGGMFNYGGTTNPYMY